GPELSWREGGGGRDGGVPAVTGHDQVRDQVVVESVVSIATADPPLLLPHQPGDLGVHDQVVRRLASSSLGEKTEEVPLRPRAMCWWRTDSQRRSETGTSPASSWAVSDYPSQRCAPSRSTTLTVSPVFAPTRTG